MSISVDIYHIFFMVIFEGNTVMLCKAKRQYLLTYKVSRYCLLALHGKYNSGIVICSVMC